MRLPFPPTRCAAATAALLLAACDLGPGYDPAPGETGMRAVVATRHERASTRPAPSGTASSGTVAHHAPLVDDDGQPMPSLPAAMPRGEVASTRLYATPPQAQALADALGRQAIVLDADACSATADVGACALRSVSTRHAKGTSGEAVAVLVHSIDDARAQKAVDRLRLAGYGRAWVVRAAPDDGAP
jgi:hypothetical protein